MGKKLLSRPYLLWMAAFTIIPLTLIVYYRLTDKIGAFIMANVTAVATAGHPKAPWSSLGLSLVSAVICLLLAYPLAMILRNRGIGKGSFVVSISALPMWISFLLRTLAWQTLLERSSVISGILTALRLLNQPLINTLDVIILGMVYDFLSFVMPPICNVLRKIDDSTIDTTHDLGTNFVQTLARIWIPLSFPGTISGITMVLVSALAIFVISNLLGGSKILLIGNVIEQKFTRGSNQYLGSGLSPVLMVLILISTALIAKYDKQGEGMAF